MPKYVYFLLTLFVAIIGYRIVNSSANHGISRQSMLFTQGLAVLNSTHFIESDGMKSYIQILNSTLHVVKSHALPKEQFGEGCTRFNGTIYQLTWKNKIANLYDNELNLVSTINYPNELKEGWGLTSDMNYLYASDGSSFIYVLNSTMGLIRKFEVNPPIANINELEFYNNHIYANVWHTPYIVKFELDGTVVHTYDMSYIVEQEKAYKSLDSESTLNGIVSLGGNNFLVTGKTWSHMYKVILN